MPTQIDTADSAGLPLGPPTTMSVPALPTLNHLLARLPTEVRASLSEAHVTALAVALATPRADHLIDYRISVRWLRQRYYVRLFVGHERRSLSRLQRENQISLAPSLALIAAVIWLMVSAAIILAIALGYFIKSAFGFDILDGDSIFHACFLGS